MLRPTYVVLTLALVLALPLAAQRDAIVDAGGVPGTRMLAGGGRLPATITDRFIELAKAAAGGGEAHVVLIPTASQSADEQGNDERLVRRWREDHADVRFTVLHTRDRARSDAEEFAAPLREAHGVWLGGGAQENLAKAYVGTRVERELDALLARGGVVAGTSAGTAIQTRTMIQEGRDPPVLATGFDFVPFAISDQHFLKRERLPRLLQALTMAPGHFGIGVDEGTAAIVAGRTLEGMGDSKVLLVLAPANGREQRIVELSPGQKADLVVWQRAARARQRGGLPEPRSEPVVDGGAVLLVGDGPIQKPVAGRFVELAGGNERGRVVIVHAAGGGSRRDALAVRSALLGVAFTETRMLDLAAWPAADPRSVALLDDATGVWLAAAPPWQWIDGCEGTPLVEALHRVLQRGGVVAAASGSTTVLGDLLLRANPDDERALFCEGYERGFALLPGCAVDGAAAAGGESLAAALADRPKWLGIAVPAGCAASVRGSELEALGAGVTVFTAQDGEAALHRLEAGQRFDLVERARSGGR